jgi:hypothetical protein
VVDETLYYYQYVIYDKYEFNEEAKRVAESGGAAESCDDLPIGQGCRAAIPAGV